MKKLRSLADDNKDLHHIEMGLNKVLKQMSDLFDQHKPAKDVNRKSGLGTINRPNGPFQKKLAAAYSDVMDSRDVVHNLQKGKRHSESLLVHRDGLNEMGTQMYRTKMRNHHVPEAQKHLSPLLTTLRDMVHRQSFRAALSGAEVKKLEPAYDQLMKLKKTLEALDKDLGMKEQVEMTADDVRALKKDIMDEGTNWVQQGKKMLTKALAKNRSYTPAQDPAVLKAIKAASGDHAKITKIMDDWTKGYMQAQRAAADAELKRLGMESTETILTQSGKLVECVTQSELDEAKFKHKKSKGKVKKQKAKALDAKISKIVGHLKDTHDRVVFTALSIMDEVDSGAEAADETWASENELETAMNRTSQKLSSLKLPPGESYKTLQMLVHQGKAERRKIDGEMHYRITNKGAVAHDKLQRAAKG